MWLASRHFLIVFQHKYFFAREEVETFEQRELTRGLEEFDTDPGKPLLDLHQIFPRVEKCTFCSGSNHEGLWMPRRS